MYLTWYLCVSDLARSSAFRAERREIEKQQAAALEEKEETGAPTAAAEPAAVAQVRVSALIASSLLPYALSACVRSCARLLRLICGPAVSCRSAAQSPIVFTCVIADGDRRRLSSLSGVLTVSGVAVLCTLCGGERPIVRKPVLSDSQVDLSEYVHRVVSFLARNFYNLKYMALVLAFCINFMLLFYKVGRL